MELISQFVLLSEMQKHTWVENRRRRTTTQIQLLERDHLLLERNQRRRRNYVVDILNELAGVIKWSPFPIVAMKHLKSDEENRQAFIAFSSDDDKISNLEHMLGVMIYGGL